MVSIRQTILTWFIGFALGFLLISRFRSGSSRMKSGFTWATIAVAGNKLRARRTTKKEAKRDAETMEESKATLA